MLNDYWNEEENFEYAVWERHDQAVAAMQAAQEEYDEEFFVEYL